MAKKNNHYIDNEEFCSLLVSHKEKYTKAKEDGTELPKLPDKVGEAFIKIATKLGTRPNFSGYSYIDEMIGDAIENCIMAANNFDSEKSKNPFSYFTQITWYAFLRRMAKEKKQTYVKYKCLENAVVYDTLYHQSVGKDHHDVFANFDLDNDKMAAVIEFIERPLKKKDKPKTGVEKFTK
jgi:hypothetical protein